MMEQMGKIGKFLLAVISLDGDIQSLG